MTEDQVRKRLERECEAAGGQSAWAREAGLSPAYVSDVIARRRAPGPMLLLALGLTKTIDYKPTTV